MLYAHSETTMTRTFLFVIVSLLLLPFAASLLAQNNEVTLISAWEQVQKADAATLKFEKLADRKYYFATKRFPFDGELLIRNVSFQDYGGEDELNIASGTVEVELQGVSEDFHRTFATSYGQWALGNTLYWDSKSQAWLTAGSKDLRFNVRGTGFHALHSPAGQVFPPRSSTAAWFSFERITYRSLARVM